MSTEITPTPEKQGWLEKIASLGSIERFVAFILGPIVIALAGTLSAWLYGEVGVVVSSASIVGAFATGGLAAGALTYKWLDGRQFPGLLKDEKLVKAGLGKLTPFADDLRLVPGANGDLHVAVSKADMLLPSIANSIEGTSLGKVGGFDEAVERLEHTIKEEISKAVAILNGSDAPPPAVNAAPAAPAQPPPPAPIPAASNDPAPATPVPAQPAAPVQPVAGQAADQGAASAQ